MKTQCFFNTFCRQAMKTPGFSMVWEHGLGVQSHESTKSNSKPKVLQCFFCATDFCHGAQNGPGAQKPTKTRCFSLLCMQQSRTLDGFAYFLVPRRRPRQAHRALRAEPSRAEPGRAGPSQAEPSRAEPSPANLKK